MAEPLQRRAVTRATHIRVIHRVTVVTAADCRLSDRARLTARRTLRSMTSTPLAPASPSPARTSVRRSGHRRTRPTTTWLCGSDSAHQDRSQPNNTSARPRTFRRISTEAGVASSALTARRKAFREPTFPVESDLASDDQADPDLGGDTPSM
jgi:hypothetical protein